MIQKSISVPDFVADQFQAPLRHMNPAAHSVERSIERVYRLINEALDGLNRSDWEVAQGLYRSQNILEPYCFSGIDDKFYIWIEERNNKQVIAIFKSRYLAADYFVWLVSQGTRKINWDLFIEGEP